MRGDEKYLAGCVAENPEFSPISQPNTVHPESHGGRFWGVIIPAHNESAVIVATISRLKKSLAAQSSNQIIVIADNCHDATAELARRAGATVYERHTSAPSNKGQSLKWLVEHPSLGLSKFDFVVILDADTLVHEDFFIEITQAIVKGARVVQGFIFPFNRAQSPISVLVSYSELLSQRIGDRLRSRLGWSVPLRGTGMAFRTKILKEITPLLHSRVEDLEMSLLLARQDILVTFEP